jgi:hypothetical protein
LVGEALDAVLNHVSWQEAGAQLVEQATRQIRELKGPVHAEAWVATRASPGVAAPALQVADRNSMRGIEWCAQLYVDTTPVEVNSPRTVFVLTARRGSTRTHFREAVDRICDALEMQEGGDYSLALRSGPIKKKWRYLPALYRLWWENPTKNRRPDLLIGGRVPRFERDDDLAGLALNITSGTPYKYWLEAYPQDWDENTSTDTVLRALDEAVRSLAPAEGTSPQPA